MAKRALVLAFSRTGNSLALADDAAARLVAEGVEITRGRIEPKFHLPYPSWLALSFVPGLGVPLKPLPPSAGFDFMVLCFPKWTFNCPPIESFLQKFPPLPVHLVVSCGGWDQERYLACYAKKFARRGFEVLSAKAVKAPK